MEIERAVKFGLIATVGISFFALATGYLIWDEYTTTIAGQEPAWLLMLLIGLGGVTAILLFLFILIGEYIDRELQAKGVRSDEE